MIKLEKKIWQCVYILKNCVVFCKLVEAPKPLVPPKTGEPVPYAVVYKLNDVSARLNLDVAKLQLSFLLN